MYLYDGFKLLLSFFTLQFELSRSQLVVNVKNNGGEVMQETILSDTVTDTVRLHFRKFDSTRITQFIDFKNVSMKNIFIIGSKLFFFSNKLIFYQHSTFPLAHCSLDALKTSCIVTFIALEYDLADRYTTLGHFYMFSRRYNYLKQWSSAKKKEMSHSIKYSVL